MILGTVRDILMLIELNSPLDHAMKLKLSSYVYLQLWGHALYISALIGLESSHFTCLLPFKA